MEATLCRSQACPLSSSCLLPLSSQLPWTKSDYPETSTLWTRLSCSRHPSWGTRQKNTETISTWRTAQLSLAQITESQIIRSCSFKPLLWVVCHQPISNWNNNTFYVPLVTSPTPLPSSLCSWDLPWLQRCSGSSHISSIGFNPKLPYHMHSYSDLFLEFLRFTLSDLIPFCLFQNLVFLCAQLRAPFFSLQTPPGWTQSLFLK